MSTNPSSLPATQAAQRTLVVERPGCFVAGAGTPVVLLHASLGSKWQWTALSQRLASAFRVISLDLCGYGDNAMPAAPASFTLDDEIRLIAAQLERLVDPRARLHVVGHSYGGLVALRLAHAMGARIATLSLYEPVAFGVLDDADPVVADVAALGTRIAEFVDAGERDEATRAFVDFWNGDGAYASLAPRSRDAMARRIGKVPLDFRAAWSWPRQLSDLQTIVAPTLLLAGTRSPAITQRIQQRLTCALPNRSVGFFDCGHMGPVTDPYDVNRWIAAFVEVCAEGDADLASCAAD